MKRTPPASGEFTAMLILIVVVFVVLVWDWWFKWRM